MTPPPSLAQQWKGEVSRQELCCWLHAILVEKQMLWCQALLPSFCQPDGTRLPVVNHFFGSDEWYTSTIQHISEAQADGLSSLSAQSCLIGCLLCCRYVTEGSFRASHRVEQSPEGRPRWASTLPGTLSSCNPSCLPLLYRARGRRAPVSTTLAAASWRLLPLALIASVSLGSQGKFAVHNGLKTTRAISDALADVTQAWTTAAQGRHSMILGKSLRSQYRRARLCECASS